MSNKKKASAKRRDGEAEGKQLTATLQALNEQRQLAQSVTQRYEAAVARLEEEVSSSKRAAKDRVGLVGNVLNYVGFVITILTLLVLIYDCRPQVVVTAGQQIDTADPLSVQFRLANTGRLAIKGVGVSCFVKDLSVAAGGGLTNLDFGLPAKSIWPINVMLPSEETTVSCSVNNMVRFSGPAEGNVVTHGDIVVIANCRLAAVPWHVSQEFRFETKRDGNGKLQWFPRARD